jgi:hypothetical protein
MWGFGSTQQQTLNRAAAWQTPPQQSRREYARVVEDEKIAAAKEVRDSDERDVFDLTGFPVQYEQPRRTSLDRRRLRDQLIWKAEFEVGGIQWPSSCTPQHICTTS